MIFFNRSARRLVLLIILATAVLLQGCGGGSDDPIGDIAWTLKDLPTFSIILDDMKEEGDFFKTYYQKFTVMTPEGARNVDWMEVSRGAFEEYLPFLGMTLFVKQDGTETDQAGPAGYEYVGNDRYGEWRNDSSGRSFWVFYGQYRLLGDLLGSGPIYRSSWNDYNTYRSSGRAYYGPNREYGTSGSYTQTQRPQFYQRGMSEASRSRTAFSDRVGSRTGRTSSSVRGRSSGVGK